MIDPARRVELLRDVLPLKELPERVLQDLAGALDEETRVAGATVVAQGQPEEQLYLIAHGRVEIWVTTPQGNKPVALLGEGETFGEQALLRPDAPAKASARALGAVRLLTLHSQAWRALVERDQELATCMAHVADALDSAIFLKRATAFLDLGPRLLGRLVERLQVVYLPAGDVLVEPGDHADACYLVRSGQATSDDGEETTSLGPGALVGEASLLTAAPHTVTIQAVRDCELLALQRTDLLAVLRDDRRTAAQIGELLRWRGCPRQASDVIAHEHRLDTGQVAAVLRDSRRGAYFRLSPQGWFLWQRLDGHHRVRDLALDYLAEFKSFAPQLVADELGRLLTAGFVEGPTLRADARKALGHIPWHQRVLLTMQHALDWQLALHHADGWLAAVYRLGICRLYTRPGLWVMTLVAFGGLAVFGFTMATGKAGPGGVDGHPEVLWLLIPAYLLSIAVHEAGHAFTVKAFGHTVPRIGIGWYWFSPVAFVDTSDMWLADRWPRIAVSLAGPFTNLLLAGAAGVALLFMPAGPVAGALWQFAFVSYLVVLINFNPVLEYDGYYVLVDWLDRPNFRQEALGWLAANCRALWRRRDAHGHRAEIAYGAASVSYVALLTSVAAWLSHGWLAEQLAGKAPSVIGSVAAPAVPIAVALAGLAALWSGARELGAIGA